MNRKKKSNGMEWNGWNDTRRTKTFLLMTHSGMLMASQKDSLFKISGVSSAWPSKSFNQGIAKSARYWAGVSAKTLLINALTGGGYVFFGFLTTWCSTCALPPEIWIKVDLVRDERGVGVVEGSWCEEAEVEVEEEVLEWRLDLEVILNVIGFGL